MSRFRADGVGLYYDERGQGRPIVLLDGFTTTHVGNWERSGWVDLLVANGYRVVALDFRSHGRSDRVFDPSQCTTARLTGDVVALVDHLSIDCADVFGFSMGGGVALDLAMTRPERVGRVVVAGVGDAALNELHDPRQIAEIRAAFKAESPDATGSPAAVRIRRNAELAGNDPKALAPFLRTGGWPGGIGEPREVSAPVLVIAAEADQYMNGIDRILRWLAHAQVLRVAARDHHDVLDDEVVRTAVLAFLGAR